MTLENELSLIETVVNECEKAIQDGVFNPDAVVNLIRSITDPETQIRKGGEWIAQLMALLERFNITRLQELKDQHPNDVRINELGRRVVQCYLTLNNVSSTVSEALVSPDVKPTVQAQNQQMRDELEKFFGTLFQ